MQAGNGFWETSWDPSGLLGESKTQALSTDVAEGDLGSGSVTLETSTGLSLSFSLCFAPWDGLYVV